MKRGKVYYKSFFAGVIEKDEAGYFSFVYDAEYVQQHSDLPLSFSMPVRSEPFHSERLFAFFDALIPEGWLLNIAIKSWKISPHDRMELLLTCCSDCIGAVSVVPFPNDIKEPIND